MTIKIDKQSASFDLPFAELAKGDSFFVPSRNISEIKSAANSFRPTFLVESDVRDNERGIRVTRVL